MGLLLCLPQHPSSTQGWFLSVGLHLHQQIQKWMLLQTICAHIALGALGLDVRSEFIAIVLSCGFVLDILMQNIR